MKNVWNAVKKVLFHKIFLIVLGAIVLLYVVFFPHTTRIKVSSDFTGVYTVQEERYFLHNMVEFTVENVCTPGTVVKSTTTEYRLNGDMKALHTINCDGTYGIVEYNNNGTREYVENTTFIGNIIQTSVLEYNDNGLLLESSVENNGTVTKTINTYYSDVDLKSATTSVSTYGQQTTLMVINYDEDGNMTSRDLQAWSNTGDLLGESNEVYEKGVISSIEYVDNELDITATIECDTTGCYITSLEADNYTLEYNDITKVYDLLLDTETSTRVLAVANITVFNYGSVIEDIDEDVQVIIDSLS